MEDIVKQILEGNFGYENGSLDFSCPKVELSLQKGVTHEGEFTINGRGGRVTYGYVTASDLRMECLTPGFSGNEEVISYRFHGERMEEGETAQGEFTIVSSQGEYCLPFEVSVRQSVMDSSIGSIKNLFHFANLAKSSWLEAVKLFYTPDFPGILTGSDGKFIDCYRGLCGREGDEHSVDEFLVAINKKARVDYITEEGQLTLDNPLGVSENAINVVRNGWGYTRLKIAVEGDFVFTEKEEISDDDFLGNFCRLPVFIDSSLLHRGRNFGKVILYNAFFSTSIPVMVRVGENHRAASGSRREKQRILVHLMEFYQAFRLKKIGNSTWLKETGRLVERMVALDEKDISARLFQAQLLISEERMNEAGWLLDHGASLLKRQEDTQSVLWAYYLYLTTLIHRQEDYVNQVTEEVELIYRRNRSSWRIAWLLLFLSEDYNRNSQAKWKFLEKQFSYGCNSPVLCIEALLLVNSNPSLMRRLGEFELRVLSYGVKQDMLSHELMEQLLYLSGRVKDYSSSLVRILECCYSKRPEARIIQEICALLIKGGRGEKKHFKWYKLGVENQLRITKLYEYYMMSIDMEKEQELPRMVLMYFLYQNSLNYEQSAFLYSYVLRHRQEQAEIYATYRERMERFAAEQIQKGHINQNLAYVYRELLTPGMIGEHMAGALSKLLFASQIEPGRQEIRKVIVYQSGNIRETAYPVINGRAWAALYGNDYTYLLEDGEGCRYVKDDSITIEKLMQPGKYIRQVAAVVKDNLELDLYLWENEKHIQELVEEEALRCIRILESPWTSLTVKRDIVLKVLKYLYEKDEISRLDTYLDNMPYEGFTVQERNAILSFMLLREKYEKAFQWIEHYGPYWVEAKTLVRLCSIRLQENGFVEEKALTAAALYAFRKGKYNGSILRYLIVHYKGLTKEMRDLWKAAVSFEVDCYELCEKMLVQMLYTGSFVGEKMDIFRYYVSQGAKVPIESAFLAQCSYDFFVKDKLTESCVFEEIRLMHLRGENLQDVCRLAFLKYYSENLKEVKQEIKELVKEFMMEMMQKGIHLKFFKAFTDFESILFPMADKTIIEYHAHPEAYVEIHYVVLQENGEAGEYLTEPMKPVFGGVCFKEFVLFFGETLQYYIAEKRDGAEQLTESGTLQKNETDYAPEVGKFQMINDITMSRALQDYDTLDALLEDYYRKEYQNNVLFKIR